MSIKVVLFDLDGTLLPMDQEVFMKAYFGRLAKKLAPHGYDPDLLMKGIFGGTKAMVVNDGSKTNEEVFWDVFKQLFDRDVEKDIPIFEDFYRNEFQEVKEDCGYDPMAAETIRTLKKKGYRVALATNPLFPSMATESRIRWTGLEPDEFEYFTAYENSSHSKPNIDYYWDVLEHIGAKPEECLMVGNDVAEDMITETIGMKVFLLTRDLINREGRDISVYPQGDFADLLAYIDTL